MNKVEIHLIAAARPNFMKVAPIYHALVREDWCNTLIVHTGQHYDPEMSAVFFQDLGLPTPHLNLDTGSGTHAEQTAAVMVAYEKACFNKRPDWVIVVGDVNSTMACTLVAKKLCIKVAHLEAGLRSGDRTMPEEINRIVTDALADLLWTPSSDADENLRCEGASIKKIQRVGNIMIDSYEMLRSRIETEKTAESFGLPEGGYGLVTLHRPINVDDKKNLEDLVNMLALASNKLVLVFPVHPRTRQRLISFGLFDRLNSLDAIKLLEPLNYVRFMSLVRSSALMITDSGGVQEETTYLGIPCLTLRDTTERPITVTQGTNRLITLGNLEESITLVLNGKWPQSKCPEFWDGKTAGRVVESLKRACRNGEGA